MNLNDPKIVVAIENAVCGQLEASGITADPFRLDGEKIVDVILEHLEGFVLVPRLSANYLFNKVPELGFKHQDEKDTVLYHLNYMASEFKESARQFVENDHTKQKAFIEAQEQGHD